MTTTPIFGLTDYAAAQATPWLKENERNRMIEAAARGNIEDRDATSPPGSCADGDCYLVKATATGAWAGHDDEMAIAVGANAASGWYFVPVAEEGVGLFVRDENLRIHHNGSAWVANAAITDITTTATSGSLPTPDGSVTIANAATPTVVELLEYCVELEAKLEAALARMRAVGFITP